MPQYPWQPHDNLDAAALDAAFAQAFASAGQALSIAQAAQAALSVAKPFSMTISFPQVVVSGTYVITGTAPYALTITSCDASVGSGTGVIAASFRSNGVAFGTASISQSAKTSFMVTGAVPAGATIDMVIAVTGSPTGAFIVLNGVH